MKHKKDMELLKCFLRSAMKIVRDLENFSFEEGLRDLSLFSLEIRKLWGDFTVTFQFLKGAYKQGGKRLFTWSDSFRTKENGFKQKRMKFR